MARVLEHRCLHVCIFITSACVASAGADSAGRRRSGEAEIPVKDNTTGFSAEDDATVQLSEHISATVGGVIVVFITALYGINCWFPRVRQFSWTLISSSVSIFLAVGIFVLVGTLYERLFGSYHYFIPLAILVWLGMQIKTFCLSRVNWQTEMHAAIKVYAHLAGFCFIFMLESILEGVAAKTGDNEALVILILVCCPIFFMLLGYFSEFARQRAIKQLNDVDDYEGDGDEARLEYLHHVAEMEIDSFALCIGLALSQIVRRCILGYLPPLQGKVKEHSNIKLGTLFAVGVLLTCVAVFLHYLFTKRFMIAGHHVHHPMKYGAHLLELSTVFGGAWCIIFWCQWFFYLILGDLYYESSVLYKLAIATIVSLGIGCLVMCIIGVQRLIGVYSAHHGRFLCSAFGLIVGLSWEKAFMEQRKEVHWGLASQLFLLVIVFPAWAYLILPQEEKHLISHRKQHSLCEDNWIPSEDEELTGHTHDCEEDDSSASLEELGISLDSAQGESANGASAYYKQDPSDYPYVFK